MGLKGKEHHIYNLISSGKYKVLQLVPFILAIIAFLKAWKAEKIAQLLSIPIQFIKEELNYWKSQRAYIKITVLSLMALTLLYKLVQHHYFPVQYDEAWTFFKFTSKSIFTSISYYPAPNNHVLHSVLTNLTALLPIDYFFALRLPSILVSVFTVALLFRMGNRLFSYPWALVLSLFVPSFFSSLEYSYMARGYSLVLFFTLILYYIAIRSIQHLREKKSIPPKYYWYIATAITLGAYTMPSFLYPCFSIMLWVGVLLLIKKQWIALQKMSITLAIVGLFVILLYAPILLISGFDSLFNNGFVTPYPMSYSLSQFIAHFNGVSFFLLNISLGVLLCCIAAVLLLGVLVLKKLIVNQLEIIFFPLIVLLTGPILMYFHGISPFMRHWNYLAVPLSFLFIYTLHKVSKGRKISTTAFLIIALNGVIVLNYSFHKYYPYFNDNAIHRQGDNLSNDLQKEFKGKHLSIFISHSTFEMPFRFNAIKNKTDYELQWSYFKPMNEDTLVAQNQPDIIINDKFSFAPKGYQFHYQRGKDLFVYRRVKGN